MDMKFNFISELAATLVRQEQYMTGPELAQLLNSNGILTSYGTPFSGERGTYTLLQAVYRRLVSEGRQADADNVAKAFIQPNGSYAWDK
jgi:hypothetical protein